MGEMLTREGYQKLKMELDYLKKVKRKELSKAISEARGHGDLKENAEYHAAKDEQGRTEARIRQIEVQLTGATLLDDENLPDDRVCIGVKVKLKDISKDTEITYTLVSPVEANSTERKISVTSPVAQGLMNKKVGDVVEIKVPAGILRYEILGISR